MHSRCLFCDKRLGFFHVGKPFCSEVHEDRYLEQESKTGLERLLEDHSENGQPAAEPLVPLKTLPPPIVPELFSYPQPDPEILEDFSTAEELVEQPLSRSDPPTATFLLSEPSVVQAQSSFPGRDPLAASFPEEYWWGATTLDLSQAMLTLGAAQIVPSAVTFTPEELPPVITAMTEDADAQPVGPPPVTTFAAVEIAALPSGERAAPLDFCVPFVSLALPKLAPTAHSHTLAPVPARVRNVQDQPRADSGLPSPEPLRFRLPLDLQSAMFQAPHHRLRNSAQIALDWNAVPPPPAAWQSKAIRRLVAPVIPRFKLEVKPPKNAGDANFAILAAMGGMEK